MTEVDRSLLRQLAAINESLCSATTIMTELLLQSVYDQDTSGISAANLRVVESRLVSSGGDLTRLGVEMGVEVDRLEQDDGDTRADRKA